jgi:hypothetical protein
MTEKLTEIEKAFERITFQPGKNGRPRMTVGLVIFLIAGGAPGPKS